MPYLSVSPIIDYDHEAIGELCLGLVRGGTEKEFLSAAYHYARDGIRFEFRSFGQTVSETLKAGAGHCYHKSNLFVALCRRKGIQAGLRYCELKAEALAPYWSEEASRLFGSGPIGHFYAAAYIDGQWRSFDPIFDMELLRYADRLDWKVAYRWDGSSEMTLPQHLIVSGRDEVLASAFPEDGIPPSDAGMLDMMNERLRAIRLGLAE